MLNIEIQHHLIWLNSLHTIYTTDTVAEGINVYFERKSCRSKTLDRAGFELTSFMFASERFFNYIQTFTFQLLVPFVNSKASIFSFDYFRFIQKNGSIFLLMPSFWGREGEINISSFQSPNENFTSKTISRLTSQDKIIFGENFFLKNELWNDDYLIKRWGLIKY